jgi:hypothetical protein
VKILDLTGTPLSDPSVIQPAVEISGQCSDELQLMKEDKSWLLAPANRTRRLMETTPQTVRQHPLDSQAATVLIPGD